MRGLRQLGHRAPLGKRERQSRHRLGMMRGRVAWGEGEGNGLLKCILWGRLVEVGVRQAGAAAVFESVGEANETVDS